MEARKKMGQLKRGVIICKASLLYTWRDEVHKHTHQKAVVVAGTMKERAKTWSMLKFSDDWTFVIISYETYRVSVANIRLLNEYKPLDFCVMDEAHKIKNPTSRVGKVIHQFPYKYKYILTATPLPNNPLEAYNYLKWGDAITANWWVFRQHYGIFGGYAGREVVGYKNIRKLTSLIHGNMLRRLKKDKLRELPDVTFKSVVIEMTAAQRKLYNAVKKEIKEELRNTTLDKIPSSLAKLLRLQQITDSPHLIGSDAKSGKLDALHELIEDLVLEGGQKVIVFSRFRGMVSLLQEKYATLNPAVIHGDVDANGTSRNSAVASLKRGLSAGESIAEDEYEKRLEHLMTSERQKEVYRFQNDPDCRIFIGCTPACREGLTLTAATHVIFLDCEWSPAYVEQAYSRAHRIGQKNAVTVHYLVCAGTIDEHVQDVLKMKEITAQALLDNGVGAVGAQRAKEIILTLIGYYKEENECTNECLTEESAN